MARVHTTAFNETDCIGDCYDPINNSLDNLDTAVQDLSSYDNTLKSAITPSGSNLIVTGNLRADTIQNTSGQSLFVNGYPRQPGQIIEYLTSPCDGSSVTVGSGTYTFQNVTTWPGIFSTYTDIMGSVLSYTPPAGTSRVLYRFNFGMWWNNPHAISHFKFFIDSNEVVFARHNRSGYYPEEKYAFEWPIAIGGTPNTNTGRLASWTTARSLKMQWRSYSSSNARQPHVTNYWDGAGSNQLVMPTLTIIAIA